MLKNIWRSRRNRNRKSARQSVKSLRIESLEDRRMLSLMADVIFLVDESGSEQESRNQPWLASIVDDLDAAFNTASIDARYGLIGFGDNTSNAFAHSYLLIPESGPRSLFTTSPTNLTAAIGTELGDTASGFLEDGWDAVEQAIAEYDIRVGAVPIYFIVQGDQGRNDINKTLTRSGVLAAVESKGGIVNSLVPGALRVNGSLDFSDPGEPLNVNNVYEWDPLFQLAPYASGQDFADIEILGVESDSVDGVSDGQHNFHWVDTDTINSTVDVPTATVVDALEEKRGQN